MWRILAGRGDVHPVGRAEFRAQRREDRKGVHRQHPVTNGIERRAQSRKLAAREGQMRRTSVAKGDSMDERDEAKLCPRCAFQGIKAELSEPYRDENGDLVRRCSSGRHPPLYVVDGEYLEKERAVAREEWAELEALIDEAFRGGVEKYSDSSGEIWVKDGRAPPLE